MKCPKCNAKMIKGYTQSPKPIFWGVRKHKWAVRPSDKGDFVLSNKNLLRGSSIKAFKCEKCKIVLTQM